MFGTLNVWADWLTPPTVCAGKLTDPPKTRTLVPFMSTTEAVPAISVKVNPEKEKLDGKVEEVNPAAAHPVPCLPPEGALKRKKRTLHTGKTSERKYRQPKQQGRLEPVPEPEF